MGRAATVIPQPHTLTGTLTNGLRVVYIHAASVAEYCGVAVRAGSRDEAPGEEGLAHFVEHTIFKGTSRRPAWRIINHMESIGGELNAYTTKEETYIYGIAPAGNAARTLDLIADLAINSQFPDAELDKEREVVAEEIDSYLDTPSEAVFDDFDDLMFKGSPLGHNILGNTATLRTFTSKECRGFVQRYYTADNMVLFYIGPYQFDRLMRLAERAFSQLPAHSAARPTTAIRYAEPFAVTRHDDNHQAHTVCGAPIPSIYSDERFAFALLNNYIGGPGMNSRLNVILRERRGLVYSVDSTTSLYSDCGLLTIYFGCSPDDSSRCMRLVTNELQRLADSSLTPGAFDAARRQYLGQLTVASASIEHNILSAARAMLFYNEVRPRRALAERINALMPDDMRRAAEAIAPPHLSSLTLK